MESRLSGRRYSYAAGHRLRKYDSQGAAVDAYFAERGFHRAPHSLTLYFWQ